MSADEERDVVDVVLAKAGERWRATQPVPPDPDLGRFTRADPAASRPGRAALPGRARSRIWAPLAAVAGIAAVFAAVVVPLALHRAGGSNDTPAPGATGDRAPGTPPPDQGAGTPVEGIGTLFRDGAGPINLCDAVSATLDLPSSGAGCGPVAVLTTGVDETWLVETTTGGQAYSRRVRVEGTYHNGTLAVTRVVESPLDPGPPFVEPPVPCAAPVGGWRPGGGFASSVQEAEPMNRLVEAVQANPARFTDVWEAHPGVVPAGASAAPVKAMVVGTTGDVARARSELSALYSGNLCVHKVRYSAADLARIADRLRAVSPTPIDASPLVIENRVQVKVVALDPPTVAVLDEVGRDALMLSEPLLQWLD